MTSTNTNNTNNIINEVMNNLTEMLDFVNEELNKPKCLCKCNSIVINRERLMTISVNDNNEIECVFTTKYPTIFSPSMARKVCKEAILKDINGYRIPLEIITEEKYYTLIKEWCEEQLRLFNTLF